MGKSTRKTPVVGNATAPSEKLFKRHSNRALRRAQERLLQATDPDALTLPRRGRDVIETWSGPKDGKHRMNPRDPATQRFLRK
jgi:hypothetical protein